MTPTTMEAAMQRLDAVLNAPVKPRSPQVRELAEHRARHGRPDDVIVKASAVVDVETDTETGTFIALVSDYLPDRELDRFVPGAWDEAIAKIRQAGKPIPLLFGHDTRSANSVIGLVQPNDIWADDQGLWIKGWLDTGDALGQRLYRMVQKGVLTWSVGFSLARKQRGIAGVTELVEVKELFEVSATPIPANPRTATAGIKSVDPDDIPSLEELRARERELGLDEAGQRRQQITDEWRHLLNNAMGHINGNGGDPKSLDAVRAKSNRLARELGPIEIASFEC